MSATTLPSPPPPYPGFPPLQIPSYSSLAPSALCDHFEESEGGAIPPSYSNSLYLRAIMPRKMELSAPRVTAKDRKWRRVLCELEGTVFRVYECSRGWWQDKIGVGDASVHGSMTYNPSGMGRMALSEEEIDLSLISEVVHSKTPRRSAPDFSSNRLESSNASTSSLATMSTSQPNPHSSSPHIQTPNVPAPSPSSLIKAYSLQQCELGVARYFPKCKNVIRIRMDGEQFLLQALNTSEVIQWIEGLQAATNVALDLDQRIMPRGPIYSRETRRRLLSG